MYGYVSPGPCLRPRVYKKPAHDGPPSSGIHLEQEGATIFPSNSVPKVLQTQGPRPRRIEWVAMGRFCAIGAHRSTAAFQVQAAENVLLAQNNKNQAGIP